MINTFTSLYLQSEEGQECSFKSYLLQNLGPLLKSAVSCLLCPGILTLEQGQALHFLNYHKNNEDRRHYPHFVQHLHKTTCPACKRNAFSSLLNLRRLNPYYPHPSHPFRLCYSPGFCKCTDKNCKNK